MDKESKFICLSPGCQCTTFRIVSFTLNKEKHGTLTIECDEGHLSKLSISVENAETVPVKPTETTLRTKVSGVTFDNPDGTNRQNLLKYVAAGDELSIICEKTNDKAIYMVRHPIGVIGTLRSETVKEFTDATKAEQIKARVLQLTGGTGDKTIIGCNIELYAETPHTEPAKMPQPSEPKGTQFVYMDPNRRDIYHADKYCSGMKNAERVAKKYAEKTLKARPCKRCVSKNNRSQ